MIQRSFGWQGFYAFSETALRKSGLEGAHAKLEFDPDVWAKVGQLIVHEIEERSTETSESQKDQEFDCQSPRASATRHSAHRP
jgi:hypothetical protein